MFQKEIVIVALLLITLFMPGCASTGKYVDVRSTSDDNAIVYIFRPNSPPVLRKPEILVNAKAIGDLSNWGYFGFTVLPGKYTVDIDWAWDTLIEDSKVSFEAKPGETYYLRVSSSITGLYLIGSPVMTFGGSSKSVSKQEAMTELEKCSPVEGFNPSLHEIHPN
jgi:hypothetical protein